jgi:hypothetical protein
MAANRYCNFTRLSPELAAWPEYSQPPPRAQPYGSTTCAWGRFDRDGVILIGFAGETLDFFTHLDRALLPG